MKRALILLCLLVAIALPAMSQTPPENPKLLFGGVGFSSANTPNIFGFGGVAIPINATVLSYNDWDANPQVGTVQFKLGRLVVPQFQFSFRTGLAAKLPYTIIKGVTIWGFVSGGLATNGETTGGSFGTGGFIDVVLNPSWGLVAILQAEKNSVTGTQFTPRFGVRYLLSK